MLGDRRKWKIPVVPTDLPGAVSRSGGVRVRTPGPCFDSLVQSAAEHLSYIVNVGDRRELLRFYRGETLPDPRELSTTDTLSFCCDLLAVNHEITPMECSEMRLFTQQVTTMVVLIGCGFSLLERAAELGMTWPIWSPLRIPVRAGAELDACRGRIRDGG